MAVTASPSARTQPQAPPAGAAEGHPAILVWFEKNKKHLSWAGTAVLVLVVGGWLFLETGKRKEAAAADALDRARAALESGNLPGASAEFQRVVQTYGGTDAAFEAQLGLNEVRLSSGQTQLAADELRKFADAHPPAFYESGALILLGGALENLGKFGEAASAYQRGAEVAAEPYRKVEALLGAARAFHLAGKPTEALGVLRGIVGKFGKETPGVAEAEVRLAEMTKGAK
jgi:tetratricopeptide (TPR) repeat protein